MISNIIDNSGPATSRGVLSRLYPARSSAFPSSAAGHVYNFNNCSVTLNIEPVYRSQRGKTEIALVAARLGQFQQLPKTRVILILNFTRPHAITYTNNMEKNFWVIEIHTGKMQKFATVSSQICIMRYVQRNLLLAL